MRVMAILLALLAAIIAFGGSAQAAVLAMPNGAAVQWADSLGEGISQAVEPRDHDGCKGDHDGCADVAGCRLACSGVGGIVPEAPALAPTVPIADQLIPADATATGRVVSPPFVPPRRAL